MTHFYHLALFNFVFGLMSIFIEIQEIQMMNGIYGDMTLYSHATILGGTTSPYIDQSQYVYKLFIYPFPVPYRYIRLDFITFFRHDMS